ncbi:MAG: PIN domain-containing protein [Kiritimatiellales bacterium]
MSKALVDTDFLSEYFGRSHNLYSKKALEYLDFLFGTESVAVCGHVYQEILYGIRAGHVGRFLKIRNKLSPYVIIPTRKEYDLAIEISRKLTTSGIQMSIADIMNCSISISKGWTILAVDKDYENAEKVEKRIILNLFK